jgi:uncharacterized protein YigE (DUF2233 family)
MLAPTLLPAVTPTPLVPDSGWQELRPGLARRVLNLADEERGWQENVTILRIDPAGYRFDVAYRPGRPLPLPNWQDETGALLVVNGGFYTEAYEATGLIISQGRQSGSSYGAFAGMFAVTPAGPEVRWLQQRPYDPAEPLLAALQSFPILVKPGHIAGFAEEDGQRARRTVVAQDKAGRILFLVAGMGHFTLRELSHFLASSDLELEVALNLDGGPSSGLLLAEPALHIPAFAPLPAVITVYLLE